MKFNYIKFCSGTNGSHRYADWDNEMMNVLKEAGRDYPSYENGAYSFLFSVKKDGKYKRIKLFDIVLPCDGRELSIKIIDKMDTEEMEIASIYIANFICIMTKHGYIH